MVLNGERRARARRHLPVPSNRPCPNRGSSSVSISSSRTLPPADGGRPRRLSVHRWPDPPEEAPSLSSSTAALSGIHGRRRRARSGANVVLDDVMLDGGRRPTAMGCGAPRTRRVLDRTAVLPGGRRQPGSGAPDKPVAGHRPATRPRRCTWGLRYDVEVDSGDHGPDRGRWRVIDQWRCPAEVVPCDVAPAIRAEHPPLPVTPAWPGDAGPSTVLGAAVERVDDPLRAKGAPLAFGSVTPTCGRSLV